MEECLSIVVLDVEARDELLGMMGLETSGGRSEESGDTGTPGVGDDLDRPGWEETRGWSSSWWGSGRPGSPETGECPC